MPGLPPSRLLTHLVETFFDTINAWFPVLYFSSITVLLEDYDKLSEEDEILLHAIITATLRFLPKDVMIEVERRSQREYSLRRVKLFVLGHVSIRTLQALVILSIDAFGTDRMPGLLALLRRQSSLLSAPGGYPTPVTPRSNCSSPPSIFDEQVIDASMVDSESLESISQAMQLLEQFCGLITVSRSNVALESCTTASSPAPTSQLISLFTQTTRSESEGTACLKNNSMTESSKALVLLSQVFDFAQVSFQSVHAATRPEWRKSYAGLNRSLANDMINIRKARSEPFVKDDGVGHDSTTASAVYQAGSIFLHSIAIQMFMDVGWNPQMAVEPWRIAINSLYKMSVKAKTSNLSPAVAFCMWTACRACVCHVRFFDRQTSSAVSYLIRTLRDIGNTWSLAKAYADNSTLFVTAMNKCSARDSTMEEPTHHFEQASPAISPMTMVTTSYPTPTTVMSDDEEMLLSCFDWSRFKVDINTDCDSNPD